MVWVFVNKAIGCPALTSKLSFSNLSRNFYSFFKHYPPCHWKKAIAFLLVCSFTCLVVTAILSSPPFSLLFTIQIWSGLFRPSCILSAVPLSMTPIISGASAPCSAAPFPTAFPRLPWSGRSYGLSESDNNGFSMPDNYDWIGAPRYIHGFSAY